MVSIHAPAWGATLTVSRQKPERTGFNPRARVGRDLLALVAHCTACGSFNPRARVGRDAGLVVSKISKRKFQSTRPRGARPEQGQQAASALDVSIHAPAWGATME